MVMLGFVRVIIFESVFSLLEVIGISVYPPSLSFYGSFYPIFERYSPLGLNEVY